MSFLENLKKIEKMEEKEEFKKDDIVYIRAKLEDPMPDQDGYTTFKLCNGQYAYININMIDRLIIKPGILKEDDKNNEKI